ncbi:MAG: TPM domain-containing protein [Candidatus Eremiobacteraeota bacterium]|nr:TPM domain-containing protein [Candidatus Eremiobacteraeota bacterium]
MRRERSHRPTRHADERKIRDAIEAAEKRTSGKIFVTLSPDFWGEVHHGARHAFGHLRGQHAMDESGILFFVVPWRRTLHVQGGAGIHSKVGQQFWDRVAHEVSQRINADDLTDGLLHGIELAGAALAQHYPRSEGPDAAKA